MVELSDIRETIRKRYADAASAAARGADDDARALESEAACCGADQIACSTADNTGVFGGTLYDEESREDVPDAALGASLGCGVPTAVADLREGETVLDLGSGAGADVLISARRVAPTGKAIGLDMTDEMLDLARANAAQAGVENVEFVKGYLEEMPLADASVDVVISNCVINLSGDKPGVIAEAARVLRPGGRFAVSDVIADPDMDEQTKADMAAWTGCIAGALTEAEFRSVLQSAGFEEIEIRATHRVHEHASSAIIRARKPFASGCCGPEGLRAAASPSTRLPAAASQHLPARCLTASATDDGGRPCARSAAALPELGARAVERVVDRPCSRPWPVARRAERPVQGPRLLGAVVTDGRRGADHDQVRRPRDGRRDTTASSRARSA